MKDHLPIPDSYPVQPIPNDGSNPGAKTCGHCGLTWDDDKPTSMTPAPAGRCPFEDFHVYAADNRPSVWISWNDGEPVKYTFNSESELNAFLTGILVADKKLLDGGGQFEQFDTLEEYKDKYENKLYE